MGSYKKRKYKECAGTDERAGEVIARRQPSASQIKTSYRKPTCWHLDLELPDFRTVRKLISII